MIWSWLADGLVVFHLAFIVFAVLGAALLLRWPRLVWLHVPAMLWAAYVEFSGRICPLTPIENDLRRRAGEVGYSGGFIEHYLLPVIYPDGLTRNVQLVLGGIVVGLNLALYALWWRKRSRSRPG
jgi:hypothetical protein